MANLVVEDRQARCFDLSVSGFNNIEIAKVVGVHRRTVAADVAAEAKRRASERAGDREQLITKSLASYERIVAQSSLRVANLLAMASTESNGYIAANLRSIVPREVHVQIKAQEQIAKTLGLLAPLEVDVSVSQETLTLRAQLLAAQNNIKFRELADAREAYLRGEGDLPEAYQQ